MSEKIEQHHRQQLSALMDGELAPDQARFLLRRLQHDHELGECWERWQVVGDVLRGQDNAMLPAGFAARVSAAIVADGAQAPAAISAGARWVRWGGGAALAASVAAMALFMAQMPDAVSPAGSSDQIVAASNLSTLFGGTTAPSTPVQSERSLLASTNVVDEAADTPRRAAGSRARGQPRPRSVIRASQREATAIAVSEAAPAATTVSPFTDVTLPVTRPWPRTVLPQYSASGSLTTDFGSVCRPPVFPAFESLPSSSSTEQKAAPTSPDAGPQP